jgi:hypothetical protein
MGTTILRCWTTADGQVACQFKGKRGGAPGWAFIVDGFGAILEQVSEDFREPIALPGPTDRTLGQGAIVELSLAAYRRAVSRLVKVEEAAESLRDGTFQILEDEVIREARRQARAKRADKKCKRCQRGQRGAVDVRYLMRLCVLTRGPGAAEMACGVGGGARLLRHRDTLRVRGHSVNTARPANIRTRVSAGSVVGVLSQDSAHPNPGCFLQDAAGRPAKTRTPLAWARTAYAPSCPSS